MPLTWIHENPAVWDAPKQAAQGSGVGGHILEKLEEEARARGLKRIFNTVRPSHPERQQVMAWLGRRGFSGADREQLYRVVR